MLFYFIRFSQYAIKLKNIKLRSQSYITLHYSYICEQYMEKDKDYTAEQEQIARYAKAMGHPARIAIMDFLASQESCFFGDIHDELPIAKATVSQHLKELKDAGLIQGEIEAPKVRYCINKENWAKAQNLFAKFFDRKDIKKICCG